MNFKNQNFLTTIILETHSSSLVNKHKETKMRSFTNRLSHHAEERRQERGVKKWAMDFVKAEFDKCKKHYGQATAISISKKKLKDMRKYGQITSEQLDKLLGVTLVQSFDNCTITVYHETRKIKY
jgi:predicted metal-dependent hydrolase